MIFVKDNAFPGDLYGYWILNDDLSFFGNVGKFDAITKPGVYFFNFWMKFYVILSTEEYRFSILVFKQGQTLKANMYSP